MTTTDISTSMKKRFGEALQSPEIVSRALEDDGTFPNNPGCPLLVYKGALKLNGPDPASMVEQIFGANHWTGSWRNGIYGFHHYHSTTHEVLGIYGGSVKAQLGGPGGITLTAGKGDVIIIPAGVAHKNLDGSRDFRCVGAYAGGRSWDMNYGKPEERPAADRNIARVPVPEMDPVYGPEGPLLKQWGTGDATPPEGPDG